jgi:ABC-type branched-subunit amino acid transport system substrate-binding protein
MLQMPRKFFILLLYVFYLLTVPELYAENLKIGVILGETGPASKWAQAQREGILLATEELKSEGIEVVFEDSGSDPKRAISAFYKLVETNKVEYIVGDVFSNITDALIPLVKGKKVVLVSPSTPAFTCRADIPNYFSISAQIFDSLPAWTQAFNVLNIKKAGFVYFDNPTWGDLYRDVWTKASSQSEQIGEFKNTDIVNTDFKGVLPKLLAKKPDTLFLAHDALGFFKALRVLKYEGRVVSANHILEHILDPSIQPLIEGAWVVDSPTTATFRSTFEKRFGHPPILEPQTSYEAIRSINFAHKHGEKLLNKVHYQGVAGEIDFRSSCAGNHATWNLFQIKQGKLLPVN